jgi:hypothetical protein
VAAKAEEYFEVNGRPEHREPSMTVTGSGAHDADVPPVEVIRHVADDDPTLIVTDSVELAVVRRVGNSAGRAATAGIRGTLTGTWPGQATPLPIAYAYTPVA